MAESVDSEDFNETLQALVKLIDLVDIDPKSGHIKRVPMVATRLANTLDLSNVSEEVSNVIESDTENDNRTSFKLIKGLIIASTAQQRSILKTLKNFTKQRPRRSAEERPFPRDPAVEDPDVPDLCELFAERTTIAPNLTTCDTPQHENLLESLDSVPISSLEEMLANLGISLNTSGEFLVNNVDPLSDMHIDGPNLDVIVEEVESSQAFPPGPRQILRRRRQPHYSVRWGRSLTFLSRADNKIIAILPDFIDDTSLEISTERLNDQVIARGHAVAHARAMARANQDIRSVGSEEQSRRVVVYSQTIVPSLNEDERRVRERKRTIRAKKLSSTPNQTYSLVDLTPSPESKLDLVYTFIALLELSNERIVRIHTDEKHFFKCATFVE